MYYSLVSAWIQMMEKISGTVYIYLSKQSMVVYVGTAFDMLMGCSLPALYHTVS